MQTIELEMAPRKGEKLAKFLDDLQHIPSNAPGLAAYHAAIAVRNANMRTGVERRCNAVKKAVKAFNVMVSIANNSRGLPTVRLYSPMKQIEILL